MSWLKFIENVESKKFLKEKERKSIFAEHCNRDFDGEVKELGDQITVRGLGPVTVYHFDKDGVYTSTDASGQTLKGTKSGSTGKEIIQNQIPEFEEGKSFEVKLTVNQIFQWGCKIGDIDKELMKNGQGVYGKFRAKYAGKVAKMQDTYIAKTMASCKECVNKEFTNGVYLTSKETYEQSGTTYTNILDFVDGIVETFNSRDYTDEENLYAECSPRFWRILKKALRAVDTDNSQVVRGRKITEYNGIYFYKTNNVKFKLNPSSAEQEYFFLRTKSAVTFMDAFTHTEAVRPERAFYDAWKGFTMFDAAVTEPNGLVHTKILGYAI